MSHITGKKEKKPVEVIVFEDQAGRSKRNLAEKRITKPVKLGKETARPIFDQKKAKYDIRKLAINGMDKTEKEIAMADFLVELGAKKARNKHVPIKEHMQDLKKRKLEGDDQATDEKSDGNEAKKPKFRRKRDKDDILGHVDGQIGTYRRGVQFIKAKGGKKR